MTATCSLPDLCPPSNAIHVHCDSSQNSFEKWTTGPASSVARSTCTESKDTTKGKQFHKKSCLFCFVNTVANWERKKVTTEKTMKRHCPVSICTPGCSDCPLHFASRGWRLEVPQKKEDLLPCMTSACTPDFSRPFGHFPSHPKKDNTSVVRKM